MGYWTVLRACVLIIAAFGCSFQLFTLTEEYFRFEVVHDLEMIPAETVQIPDVTFSVDALSFINFTKLGEKFPEKVKLLNEKYSINETNYIDSLKALARSALPEVLSSNFTVADLMSVCYDKEDFIQVMAIPSIIDGFPVINETLLKNICSRKIYLKDGFIYITNSCYSKRDNLFNANLLFDNSIRGTLILFTMNHEIFKTFPYLNMYLHTPKTNIRGIRMFAISLPSSKKVQAYPVTYKRTMSQLLPSPYETDCYDYTKDGYESRLHAIEECYNRLSMEKMGLLFPENIQNENSNAFLPPIQKALFNQDETVKSIRKQCAEENTKQDCVQEVYTPQYFPGVSLNINNSLILLKVSRDLDVIKSSRPKTSLVEYITLATSVVGFWFGFSITGSLIVALSIASNKQLIKKLKHEPKKVIRATLKRKPFDKADRNNNTSSTTQAEPRFRSNKLSMRVY